MNRIPLATLVLITISGITASFAAPPSLPECLSTQLSLFPQEKVYLHTDKDSYIAGDMLWFRAYVVDAATHEPLTASRYVYAELQSSEKPPSGEERPAPVRIRILERDGIYAGYFPLPLTSKSGDYTLTAYTAYMRNLSPAYFFRKNIRVGAYGTRYSSPEERGRQQRGYDVTFHPEGGYLIAGHPCWVGFKALRPDGLSVGIRGRIVDDMTGEEVARFETLHAGMGKVSFTPRAGHTYTAECRNEFGSGRKFRLPEPADDARVLQIMPSSERFTVTTLRGEKAPKEELRLLIHCRGQHCYSGAVTDKPLSFDKEDFPEGVLQVLLLDRDNNVLSERLLLNIDEKHRPRIIVTPDKESYGPREKITLQLQFKDEEGNPLQGDFSVAVTDNRMVDPYRPSDIRTSLLLESELRGYIEDPASYFDTRNRLRQVEADALMLTQGWRRYDIPEVLKGHYAEPREPLEIGQEITGRIRKTGLFKRKNFEGYKVAALVPRFGSFLTADVDEEGRFVMNGFDYPDSTYYVLQATGPNEKTDVELTLDEERYPNVGEPLPRPDWTKRMERYNENFALFTDSLRNILIEEVIISGQARKLPETPYEVLADKSVGYEEIEEYHYTSIGQILTQKGLNEVGGHLTYRGLGVKFMVDGILELGMEAMPDFEATSEALKPIKGGSKQSTSLQPSWTDSRNDPYDSFKMSFDYKNSLEMKSATRSFDYNAIPIDMVKRIDIIPPHMTALFGHRVGHNALIVITSKDGSELFKGERQNMDILNLQVVCPSGHQNPAEFYSPKYETDRLRNAPERDLRTTIYWNSSVQSDKFGCNKLEFYSADDPSDYFIMINGLENNTPLSYYYNLSNL